MQVLKWLYRSLYVAAALTLVGMIGLEADTALPLLELFLWAVGIGTLLRGVYAQHSGVASLSHHTFEQDDRHEWAYWVLVGVLYVIGLFFAILGALVTLGA